MPWVPGGKNNKHTKCFYCHEVTDSITRQHLFDEWKPFCPRCHTEWNYYLAQCEERRLTFHEADIQWARDKIEERKKEYGEIPLPHKKKGRIILGLEE